MRDLILHIGRHKSGTSSLQRFLVDNYKVLLEHGWLYPKHGRGDSIAHHSIATYFNPNQFEKLSPSSQLAIQEQVSLFRKEISQHDKVIISSENFQNINPKNIKKELENINLTVVIYLREIISYFLSSYSQAIKANKLNMEPDTFLKKRFRANYYSHIKSWKDNFPNAKIVVSLFDKKTLHNEDIRQDFLHNTSLENELSDTRLEYKNYDSNPSISGELLAFKRELNRCNYESIVTQKDLYHLLQEMARNIKKYSRFTDIESDLKWKLIEMYETESSKTEYAFGLQKGSLINKEFKESEHKKHKNSYDSIRSELDKLSDGLGSDLCTLINDHASSNHIINKIRSLSFPLLTKYIK